MSDHPSRYHLSYSYRPSTSSFFKQLIRRIGALSIAAIVLAVQAAPHHHNCAAAYRSRTRKLTFASFIPILFARRNNSDRTVEFVPTTSLLCSGRTHKLDHTRARIRRRFVTSNLAHVRTNEKDNKTMKEHHGQRAKNTEVSPLGMKSETRWKEDTILSNEGEDDASEDNSPRRGRPGIVVFSGGTAFNAASAEMASRSVGVGMDHLGLGTSFIGANNVDHHDDDIEGISRSNSMSNLIDMMTMESMQSMTSTRSDVHQSNIAPGGGGLKVWHVLPVTDDGGSTAEIVRVLGGPAVGDIRSRLLRLAPGTTREARAVRRLLGHRLVSMQSLEELQRNGGEVTNESVSRMAREEWMDILDGGQYQERIDKNGRQNCEHPLWKDVSAPYRSIIRAFLVHFHNQVLQTHNGVRQSQSNPSFDFTGGSVGNFFFAGARTFFGSLSAAIFLFSKVAGIPSGSRVLPAVISEERLELGAELRDGTRIRGQYNISHPHTTNKPRSQTDKPLSLNHKPSRHRHVIKSSLDSKEAISSLHPSPISKIVYLLHDPTWRRREEQSNSLVQQWSDRHDISLEPNPLVLDAIANANIIVYGCGSLFTSLLPSLILDGVGPAISSRKHIKKVLLLNGWHDCETSWTSLSDAEDDDGYILRRMDALSIVKVVVDALDQGGDVDSNGSSVSLVTDYISHIFYPIGTEIDVDEKLETRLCAHYSHQYVKSGKNRPDPFIQVRGINSIPANTCSEGIRSGGLTHHRVYDPRALVDALLSLA